MRCYIWERKPSQMIMDGSWVLIIFDQSPGPLGIVVWIWRNGCATFYATQMRRVDCHNIYRRSPDADWVDKLRLWESRPISNPPLTVSRIGLLLWRLPRLEFDFWVRVLRRWRIMKNTRSAAMTRNTSPPIVPPIMAALWCEFSGDGPALSLGGKPVGAGGAGGRLSSRPIDEVKTSRAASWPHGNCWSMAGPSQFGEYRLLFRDRAKFITALSYSRYVLEYTQDVSKIAKNLGIQERLGEVRWTTIFWFIWPIFI